MARVRLRTERLVLREVTEADVDRLVALDGDPEVMRYLTGGRPTPRADVEAEVLPRMLGWHRRGPWWGYFAAEDREGAFVGWFCLRAAPGDPDDVPELGYRLRREAWGRGLATEGSRALVDSAFAEAGAVRVRAQTMAVNAGSRRVMEKVGLRLVGTLHLDRPESVPGSEHGGVEYALDRVQWQRSGRR